jgi:hypothetical protein
MHCDVVFFFPSHCPNTSAVGHREVPPLQWKELHVAAVSYRPFPFYLPLRGVAGIVSHRGWLLHVYGIFLAGPALRTAARCQPGWHYKALLSLTLVVFLKKEP